MSIGRIDGVLNSYKANSIKKPIVKSEKTTGSTPVNKDRVEFDFDRSLNAAKANIVSDLKRELSGNEIEKIQNDIQKEGFVDSQKLVDYIFTF